MAPSRGTSSSPASDATPDDDEAPPSSRDRIIDAAERCLRQWGIRRTTMTEVAMEAGTSRAWLYRNFPDKASLVVATLARTDDRFWAEAHAHVSAASGLAAQVTAAVQLSLDHQPGTLALRLQAEEPEAFASVVGRGLRELLPGMATFWREFVVAAQATGEVRADLDVVRAAEWILRMVVSLVTIPLVDADGGPASPAELHRFVEDHLVPGLS